MSQALPIFPLQPSIANSHSSTLPALSLVEGSLEGPLTTVLSILTQNRPRNSPGINTCNLKGLKVPWNEYLRKIGVGVADSGLAGKGCPLRSGLQIPQGGP